MKAYLVLGPERSGTRLMTHILIAAGCFGDDGHDQKLDNGLPDPEQTPAIVWRRSLPHRQEWPNLQVMVNLLKSKGYEVQAIVTTRDWFAVAQSQVSENLVPDVDLSYRYQQRAYSTIFAELMLNKVPFVVVSYEHLVQRSKPVITRLMEYLGLPALLATGVEVYDGNEKWYQ